MQYETIRDVIPDKIWDTIPERAQVLICAGDMDTIAKMCWKPALLRLRRKAKTGKPVNVKEVARQEAQRALKAGAFDAERLRTIEAAFLQKAQASFYRKTKEGLPEYLKVAPRTYQITDAAPQEAWDAFTMELVDEQVRREDVMDRWLKRYVERWGQAPDVHVTAASAPGGNPKPKGRRRSTEAPAHLHT